MINKYRNHCKVCGKRLVNTPIAKALNICLFCGGRKLIKYEDIRIGSINFDRTHKEYNELISKLIDNMHKALGINKTSIDGKKHRK